LYGCSADGTICAISFDKDELHFSDISDLKQTEAILAEFEYKNPRQALRPALAPPPITALPNGGPSTDQEHVLTVRRGTKGKKRVNPMSNGLSSGNAFAPPIQSMTGSSTAAQARAQMMQGISGAFGANGFGSGGTDAGPSRGHKRKMGDFDDYANGSGYSRAAPRLMESQTLRAPRASSSTGGGKGRMLALPLVKANLSLLLPSSVTFEAINPVSEAELSSVRFSRSRKEIWEDTVSSAVLAIASTDSFSAAGLEDGSLVVYGSGGRL
jgi:protein HIRA/HIR1